MSKTNWNNRYPKPPLRPTPSSWPAWYRVERDDLASFLRVSGINLNEVRSILDIGSGDGQRVIHAVASNNELNRSDLHVTCVDFSVRAILWGIDLWSRLRLGMELERNELPSLEAPRWSMSFREEDLTSLPLDILNSKYDVIVDWMTMHGLQLSQVSQYVATIKRLSPRYFVLKCFSMEGSTLSKLPRAVDEVDKHQWSESALCTLFCDRFDVVNVRQCAEDLAREDGDGPRAAKREYCFRLKSGG